MATRLIARPGSGENVSYYDKYINQVPDGDVLALLVEQNRRLVRGLEGLSDEKALFRYAPEKWSVKEVLGHLADGERVFAYRALRIARADETPLAGFDENTYVPAGQFDRQPLRELLDNFAAVRAATVSLFRGLDDAAFERRGTANDSPISVSALAWIMAGHERHHAGVLRDRYGLAFDL